MLTGMAIPAIASLVVNAAKGKESGETNTSFAARLASATLLGASTGLAFRGINSAKSAGGNLLQITKTAIPSVLGGSVGAIGAGSLNMFSESLRTDNKSNYLKLPTKSDLSNVENEIKKIKRELNLK